MEILVILLIPLPFVLLIILALLVKKFEKETRIERLYKFIGMYGKVISPVDKRDGAIIMDRDGEETIVFCQSYGSKIREGESVLITEYDFVNRTFKIERSPKKILRT